MMTKKVDFYFDFASPNAYLSHKVMQSIKERTGAEINYIPVLLGGIFKLTNNKPPMEQFFGVKNKNEYQNIEMQRFIKRYGLDKFQMNPHFPVISLQIIRGAVAADKDGYTAVMEASLGGHLEIVEYLKSKGASLPDAWMN